MNGYDRIKELYLNSQNKNKSLSKIVKHLMMKDNMNDIYLKESKNLDNMMKYINMRAKEQAVNNVAVIDDTDVYNWAYTYFTETDSVLGLELPKNNENKGSKIEDKTIEEDKKQLKMEI